MNSRVPSVLRRRLGRLGAGLAALAVLAVPALAVPSIANAAEPCSEQVCLFDTNGAFVGAYQDVTDFWQPFRTTRTATALNGFEEHAVYFSYSDGNTSCIQPKRQASVDVPNYGAVVGLKIVPGGNCYPDGDVR